MEQEIVVPDPEVLRDFWTVQRSRAHLSELEPYLGSTALGALVPPAWAWGTDRAEADAFAAQALEQGEFVLRTPEAEFDDEDLPTQGTASILCNGSGRPVALVSVVHVAVVTDGDGAEGGGDRLVEERHRVVAAVR